MPPTPVYLHEVSPHYWSDTEPTNRRSQESFTSRGPLYNDNNSLLDWDVQS